MYNVVFRYTENAGGYDGIITWTPFKSKANFDQWLTKHTHIKRQNYPHNHKVTGIVIAEGVTNQEAINLARTTPQICYLSAALEDMAKTIKSLVQIQKGKLKWDVM